MGKIVRLLWAAIVVMPVVMGLSSPVRAQAEVINVLANEAEVDYPDTVTFRLVLDEATKVVDAQLTYAQPGTAYLAVQSKARILPVGLIGTEQILVNMLRLRRTDVTIHIGPVFGPLDLDPAMDRNEQRQYLGALAEQCMYRVAALFPPENRGPYRGLPLESPA